ncbi:MAG: SDR family NAD(P)-dependent oxidoreductase [Candidatus Staskawiczbacteria bacterium]|nr:SDR family NAD(P)-dependent oxidoreductase [Candidatus Staskawiczbacteria bacterium]
MDFSGKRVLITGGAGFIGSHIAANLDKKGFRIRLFDLNFKNFDALSKKLEYNLEPQKVIGSVLDTISLREAVRGCDYVVHAAAMLGVRNTENKKLECLDVNILGTINVLDACVKENVKRIVFTSSSEVYGEPIECPIRETNSTSPVSLYGVSKLAGEEYIKAYQAKHRLDYSIVRFFNVYGPGQVAEFVMPRFIKNVLNNEPPIVYGEGSQVRAFCFVEDAAEGVSRVLTEGNGKNQIFNIGNDEESISMKDLAEKVIKISGKNLQPRFVAMQDSDREESREIQKRIPTIYQARQLLKYKPIFSLDVGIKKVIDKGCIFDTWSYVEPETAQMLRADIKTS